MRGRGWLRAAMMAAMTLAAVAEDAPRATVSAHLTNIAYTMPAAGARISAFSDGAGGTLQSNFFGDTNFSNNPVGIAIVAADTTNGTWEWTANQPANTGWSALSAVSASRALLLEDDPQTGTTSTRAGLRFTPTNPAFTGTATIQFRGWDTQDLSSPATPNNYAALAGSAFSAELATLTVTVASATNVAPTLAASTGNLALDATAAGWTADPGTKVATLLSRVRIGAAITDADGPRTGIGIVAANTANGSWQYDTGTGWRAFPGVSFTSGLRLASDSRTRIRFVANGGFSGVIATALTFTAWDGSDGGLNGSSSGIAGNAYSTSTDTASIIVSTAGAATFAGASPSFAGTLSVRGSTRYEPLGLVTDAGMARLVAAIGGLGSTARAFAWDSAAQHYVELPAAPAGGLDATDAVFIATKRDFAVDLSGRCAALPYDLVIHPGWNFIAIPALTDGVATAPITSHPWADVDALDAAGVRIVNPVFDADIGQPWQWNGSSYVQVSTLDSGIGYWVDNLHGGDVTLRRTAAVVTRGLRSATAAATPPPPPADASASGHHGCGAGGGLAIAGAAILVALRLRRTAR